MIINNLAYILGWACYKSDIKIRPKNVVENCGKKFFGFSFSSRHYHYVGISPVPLSNITKIEGKTLSFQLGLCSVNKFANGLVPISMIILASKQFFFSHSAIAVIR